MGKTVKHVVEGWLFTWDSEKATKNLKKHGVSFYEACEVFFDPLYVPGDASVPEEQRHSFIGYSERLLYVVAAEQDHVEDAWRIISAREAEPKERKRYEEADDSD